MAKPKFTGCGRVRISSRFIDDIEPTGKRERYYDTTVRELVLMVGSDGRSKSWGITYFNRDRKRKTFTIGPVENWDPGAARTEAKRLLGLIAQGHDPAAEKVAARLTAERADAASAEAAKRTLDAYLTGDYRHHVLAHRKSGKATEKRIRAAWAPFLDCDMSTLTVGDVTKHVSTRRSSGIKVTTLNRDRTALLALLNQAVEDGLLEANPLKRWQRLAVADDKRVRWLGQMDEHEDHRDGNGNKISERERFMGALEDQATPDYLRDVVHLALNTGLRRGELLSLAWGAVDFKTGKLTVAASTTKTSKQRHVALNATALEVLKARRQRLGVLPMPTALVFPSPSTGAPLTHVKRSWASLVRRARVQDFHLHDCRHDFASRLVQSGTDLYLVSKLLGHSSITLTERYAHLAPDAAKAAVERLV